MEANTQTESPHRSLMLRPAPAEFQGDAPDPDQPGIVDLYSSRNGDALGEIG